MTVSAGQLGTDAADDLGGREARVRALPLTSRVTKATDWYLRLYTLHRQPHSDGSAMKKMRKLPGHGG